MEDKVTQTSILERGDDVLYICTDNGAYMNEYRRPAQRGQASLCSHHHPSGRPTVRGQDREELQAVADKNIEMYGLMGVKTNAQNQSIDC